MLPETIVNCLELLFQNPVNKLYALHKHIQVT